jgi:hypothetical protein
LVNSRQLGGSKKPFGFNLDYGAQDDHRFEVHQVRPVRRLGPDGRSRNDLLANTVLYKLGHHGSHNATLRQKGLEMMTHPELVAMLPVEKTAVERLGYGEMPLASLVRELEKRTEGRLLQLDKKGPDGKAPGAWKKGMLKARLADETFKAGADGRAVYVEYTVADA